MKDFLYCPFCRGELVEKLLDERTRKACPSCSFVHYRNPAPAAGVILLEEEGILLVKRKFEPRRGMWSLPAGFLEADEDIRACAVREMKEETNLDVEITGLFEVYSAFDDPRTSALLVVFLARRFGGELLCGDDASEARFFALDELPSEVAFEAHRRALAHLRERLARGELTRPR